MKTVCLKTNNEEIIKYMIRKLKSDFEDIIISTNKFKIYRNVIIHYNGKNEKKFLLNLSDCMSEMFEKFFEEKILAKIIDENYFYFEDFEKDIILKICEKIIEIQEANLSYKKEILKGLIYDYFIDNKVMILDGFMNFRVKPYLNVLDYVVDTSVSNFVIGLN